MKKLFLIDESLAGRISYFHLALFLAALPFDSFYTRLILISLCIHTAIHARKQQWRKLADKRVFILAALYILSLAASLYSVNPQEALFDLTKELGIIIFPIVFVLQPIDLPKYRNNLLTFFLISCVATVVFLFADAFRVILYYKMPASFIFSESFLNQHFSEPLQLHATYLSMYVAVALFFALDRFKKLHRSVERFLMLAAVLLLVASLFQLASRAVIIGVVVTVIAVFPFLVLQRRRRFLFLALTGFLFAGIGLCIGYNDSLHARYINEFRKDLQPADQTESRASRWLAIVDLIRQKPLIGYGTGSETNVLKKKYLEKKFYVAWTLGLNTHNQYLGYLLRAGIAGLAVYLFTLGFGFYKAAKSRDFLFFGFMIIIGITSMSENILDVNKGIFFYSFFISFFVFSGLREKKINMGVTRQPVGNGQPLIEKSVLY